jgi:hypothetical protein
MTLRIETSSPTTWPVVKSLCEYYSDIKTKRQLNLDVPVGFCQRSTLQKDFNEFLPPCKLGSAAECPILQSATPSSTDFDNNFEDDLQNIINDSSTSVTNNLSCPHVPIL